MYFKDVELSKNTVIISKTENAWIHFQCYCMKIRQLQVTFLHCRFPCSLPGQTEKWISRFIQPTSLATAFKRCGKSIGLRERTVSISSQYLYGSDVRTNLPCPIFYHLRVRTGNGFSLVCMSVCVYRSVYLPVFPSVKSIPFESWELGSSFSACRHILATPRLSLSIRVLGSMSRSNKEMTYFN